MKKNKSKPSECMVSIIMPCYNCEDFIGDAIRSVVEQTYSNWELLVCDDGSSDLSLQVAREFSDKDNRITVLQNKYAKGAAGARNTCLSVARGRYIAFLDADDIWLPEKLEKQLNFMQKTKSEFSFSYCETIDESGRLLGVNKTPKIISLQKLRFSNFIPCLTVIYDSEKIGTVEQPIIPMRNDFALWIKILLLNPGVRARCVPEVLARYRVNNYGISSNKIQGIYYFHVCLVKFAGTGRLNASLHTAIAIGFKLLKTVFPRFYNVVVSRFI